MKRPLLTLTSGRKLYTRLSKANPNCGHLYTSFKAIIFGPSPPPKDIALFRTDGLVSTDDMEKAELLESYFDFSVFIRKNDLQFGKGRINMVRRN